MTNFFLAGHGEWGITKNGFTRLPKGITVTFYTEFSKNMFTADLLAIIGGTFQGQPKDVYNEGSQVPNYTLFPDTVNEPRCRQLVKVRNDPNYGIIMVCGGATSTLQKMSILSPGTNVIWCACRRTELKDSGGKTVGVNAAQGACGDRDAQGNGTVISGTDLY